MRRKILTSATFICMMAGSYGQAGFYQPPNGFVPDAATAVRIAEAVLSPIYGDEQIKSERPFKAVLSGNTRKVVGTLPPQYMVGGTAVISIDRRDGRISHVIHYK